MFKDKNGQPMTPTAENKFINDYNTHEPKKRDFLYNLVRDLLAKGVPIDGVGHQSHIRLEFPAISEIEQSIEKFASLGLGNQITELDMGLYSNDTDRYETIPESMLIRPKFRPPLPAGNNE